MTLQQFIEEWKDHNLRVFALSMSTMCSGCGARVCGRVCNKCGRERTTEKTDSDSD